MAPRAFVGAHDTTGGIAPGILKVLTSIAPINCIAATCEIVQTALGKILDERTIDAVPMCIGRQYQGANYHESKKRLVRPFPCSATLALLG